MISTLKKTITFRYLKKKKKDGFLNIISIFSFIGISLGVAVLIIVMSVMNGFRTELINKILGFNPHIIVKPYDKKINIRLPRETEGLPIGGNIGEKYKENIENLSSRWNCEFYNNVSKNIKNLYYSCW